MATNKDGYECEFVEKPQKAFQSECPVCLLVLREPFQVTCCGYAFCQACIVKVKQQNKPCPCCNSKDFNSFEDKRLKRSLYEFKVYCTNKQQGCKWVGELRELDNHLNYNSTQEKQLDGCPFVQVKCQYCPKLHLRIIMNLHQDDCPKRPFICKYCNKFKSTYEAVTSIHWPVCGYYPVPCTNRCGKTTERQNLEVHIANQCSLTIVDCDFKHVGCEVKLPRKDMPTHIVDNVVKHVSLHAESYKQLKEENKQLKQQVAQLTQDLKVQHNIIHTPICPAEFTMTNIEQHKLDDDEWISPPFYTCPKGYKMCIIVRANGLISTYTDKAFGVRLIKGEFDDQLEWPLHCIITIKLRSQEDTNFYRVEIPINEDERVLNEESEKKWLLASSNNWISCTLPPKHLKNKYLKNDCLKLCAYKCMKLCY